MFHNAPTLFALTVIAAVALTTVALSVLWVIFAVTLVVTTLVAVSRSIPRKER